MAHIIGLLMLCSLGLTLGDGAAEFRHDFTTADLRSVLQLRPLAVEFFDHFQNFTPTQLMLPDTHIDVPTPEDLLCLADLNTVSQGLSSGSLFALKFIDAWGTIPSGMLYGNIKDLGNYDECIKINQKLTTDLRGKYCPAALPVGKLFGDSIASSLNVETAICMPASCSGKHMDVLLKQLLKQLLNIDYSDEVELVKDQYCQTAGREPFDGLTIFTIVLLSVLGALMALATLYDYFVCTDQKQLPPLVKVFSARANSRFLFRIVDTKSNPNIINCLNGIRCLSFAWVIFGHDYILATYLPNINAVRIYGWLEQPFTQLVINGVFSVDTFFFLSGLLVCMVCMRVIERQKGKLNVPLMYLHRYLRLTPILALCILVSMKLKPYMADGPLWGRVVFDNNEVCERTWYLTLLYVQNYATKEMCISHSWYLAVDMQLYVLAPVLLLALYKWGRKAAGGIVVLILLLAACLFSTMVINDYNLYIGAMTNIADSMLKIYFPTHMRAAPWLIGVLFGYFLHCNRGKNFQLSRLQVWAGWLLGLGLIFASLFALYPAAQWDTPKLTPLEDAFFVMLTRIAWPLGLCWVVFACHNGYGGLANSFLSSPLWQPLSKLTYGGYIWHIVIEEINAGRTRTNTYFSDYDVMLRFWADFGFTILLAYFMYILVEGPFGGLESMLLPDRKPTAMTPAPIAQKTVPEFESAPPLPAKAPSPDAEVAQVKT